MLENPQTTGYLRLSVASFRVSKSLFYLQVFLCTSDDEWSLVALRDLYLQDTVYHIKSKQNTNALSTLPGIAP